MADEDKPKDFWDKLDACSGLLTFISALLIAAVGWYFTEGYKLKEHKLAELEVTSKMLPFLKEGNRETKAALLAMATLGSTELATQFATLYGGSGAVAATASIAKNPPSPGDASVAREALNSFTKTGAPTDAVAAANALSALQAASATTSGPVEQIVVVTSGPKASGSGKSFNNPPYELCGEAPPGYEIADAVFRLTGDRACGAWSECKPLSRTPQRVCWAFSMQGHDELPAPGQALSEGTLRIIAKRK
jgi:hypothetical protein